MDDKDLEKVWKELPKRLGLQRKTYPEGAWKVLLQHSHQEIEIAATDPSNENWELLTIPALPVLEAWEAGGVQDQSRRDEQTGETVPSRISDHERERSRVYSEYLAKHASRDPRVRDFRSEYLDDQLLSPHQARDLLTSPVVAYWSHQVFDRFRVPLVGHGYRVRKGMDEEGPYSLVKVFTPDSRRNRRIQPLKDRRTLQPGRWELPDWPADARSNWKLRRELDKTWKIVPFPGKDGHTHRVLVRVDSFLGALHRAAGELIQRYPWEEPDAVWFLLTAEVPWVVPVTWQARWFGGEQTISSFREEEDTFSYGFITLKAAPWVSPETVQQIFREALRNLRGEHRSRRLEDKSLKLLQFVYERVNVADLSRKERRKLGPELVAAWDEENPKHRYEGNTHKFWRDFNRVRRAVLSPSYEWRGEE